MAKTFAVPVSFSLTVTLSSAAVERITKAVEELQMDVRKYYQDDSATPATFLQDNYLPLGYAEGIIAKFTEGGVEAVYPMLLSNAINQILQEELAAPTGDEKVRVSPAKVG